MLFYAPNISWLFPELPFSDRPNAVAEAGFDAIEFGLYGQADLEAVRKAQDSFGLKVVLFNMDLPIWDETHRGYLADPSQKDTFRRALDESLKVGMRIHASKLMLPVGANLQDLTPQQQEDCIVENLGYAAPLAQEAGIALTIEALNPTDFPNYFLTSSRQAIRIVKRVDHPNVKFQFDTYQLQVLEGNLIQTLKENIATIGHIQFADAPDRTEPGYGELNFANIDTAIEKSGYEGYVGLEYIPVSTGSEALAWVPDHRKRPPVRSGIQSD